MGARVFVDTNVLIRALHEDAELHTAAANLIIDARGGESELWISRQVIREYFVNVTRTGVVTKTLTAKECTEQLVVIEATFNIADETSATTKKLMALMEAHPILREFVLFHSTGHHRYARHAPHLL